MISEDTPFKLADIIRDTWPQMYWLNSKRQEAVQPANSENPNPEFQPGAES